MSCYNWEGGTIKIPHAEWPKFKKRFRDDYNAWMERLHAKALQEYQRLVAAGKGKRNFDFRDACWELFGNRMQEDEYDMIKASLFPDGRTKPIKPQKKAFPKLNAATKGVENDDCYVGLNEASKTVRWDVPENNRAQERARETQLAQSLFRSLRQVKWTRGSGGQIVGNDEYNRDCEGVGGGGNYLVQEFGPEKKGGSRRW